MDDMKDRGGREVIVARETVVVEDGVVIEDVIDIEEWILSGRSPHHHAKVFLIKVDKQKYDLHHQRATGREILTKAGKLPPENYILRMVKRGGALEKIELDQTVDLVAHGVEKFRTMLKNALDGSAR